MQTWSLLSSYCTVDHLSSFSCTSISIEMDFFAPHQHKEWKEQLESQWERKTTSQRRETDETERKDQDKRSDDPLYKRFEMTVSVDILNQEKNERGKTGKIRNRKLWPGSDCFHTRQEENAYQTTLETKWQKHITKLLKIKLHLKRKHTKVPYST